MCKMTKGKISKVNTTTAGGGSVTRNAPAVFFCSCKLALNCYVKRVGKNTSSFLFPYFHYFLLSPKRKKKKRGRGKKKKCIQQWQVQSY